MVKLIWEWLMNKMWVNEMFSELSKKSRILHVTENVNNRNIVCNIVLF